MTKLMTLSQTAERLNTAESTLRWWLQQGTAPASIKLGRRRMFREEDVEAWLAEQAAKSA